jgi:hypothetical protein
MTETSNPPIACDMTNAPDSPQERLDEYRRLFGAHLAGRERTADGGIRFRFRADGGVEAWVRDLAAREKACCAFFDFDVAVVGDEVIWDGRVVDDDTAREILAEFYQLPEAAGLGVDALLGRYTERGLTFMTDGVGSAR